MTAPGKWIKARDLKKKLARDPGHKSLLKQKRKERAQLRADLNRSAGPIFKDLRKGWVRVRNLHELAYPNVKFAFRRRYFYEALARHLDRSADYPIQVLDAMATALCNPDARFASWATLINVFGRLEKNPEMIINPNETVGHAIARQCTAADTEILIDLLNQGEGNELAPILAAIATYSDSEVSERVLAKYSHNGELMRSVGNLEGLLED